MKKFELSLVLILLFKVSAIYSAQFNEHNDSLLSILIKNGDYDLAKTLIQYPIDVNQLNIMGENALLEAVRANQTELVKKLITFSTLDIQKAIEIAQENNNIDLINILKMYKSYPFSISKAIQTQPYIKSEQVKNLKKIQNLIYDIQNSETLFRTEKITLTEETSEFFGLAQKEILSAPLFHKLKYKDLSIFEERQIQILNDTSIFLKYFDVNNGIDTINKRLAVYIIEIIINKFKEIEKDKELNPLRLLEIALSLNSIALCKLIFKSEMINPANYTTEINNIFLYNYTTNKRLIVVLLINHGFNLNVFLRNDDNFISPFLSSLTIYKTGEFDKFKNFILSIILTLHKSNPGLVNLNIIDTNGETALITAIKSNNTNAARSLIKSGADVNIVDNTEYTALSHAIDNLNFKIIKLLMKNNSRLTDQDLILVEEKINDLQADIISLLENTSIDNNTPTKHISIQNILDLIDIVGDRHPNKAQLTVIRHELSYLNKLKSSIREIIYSADVSAIDELELM